MNKHKILVVCQHYWPESFRINDVCDYFVEQGCKIDVLCGIPNYPIGKFFEGYGFFKKRSQTHRGVNIRRVFEMPRGKGNNLGIFLNYVSFPLASLLHVPRLLFKKYDKIFIYQTSPVMMGFAGIIVGKLKKTETTMYVLDLWPENLFSVLKIKSSIMRRFIRWVSIWHYRNADKLVVLSDRMKSRLLESIHIPSGKITVLPQACEKIYEEKMSDEKLNKKFKNGFNVLFTGTITPAQSFETILDAAKILERKDIDDINWIIVGDGMSRQWLEERVGALDLNRFYFEGLQPVKNIPKYTNVADALVGCLVKSDLLEATIPAKVLSYIAAGKPVVLAMDGEAQHLIENDAKCGFVGPTEDSKTLARNILKLYNMPKKQRQQMGDRGREYHLNNLERNIVLNKLYDFIFN